MREQPEVLIIGGGLAGLCCARYLVRSGRIVLVLEAGDTVGGRVRTESRQGFLLDRGFQVLLTAYPECRAVLDYDALSLSTFEPGALVWLGGRFTRVLDPVRRPGRAPFTIFAPVGSFTDKLRILSLRQRVMAGEAADLLSRPATSTRQALEEAGFSARMIDRFFRPFYGGIFLEGELSTSSRKFDYVFRMFSEGLAALPAAGMGAIPAQIADGLPPGSVRTGARVEGVGEGQVYLAGGEGLRARAVVVATDGAEARRLVGLDSPGAFHGTTCLYFAAEKAPLDEPLLVLNGEASGPVNNLAVPSNVAPTYAPPGASLISATVLGVSGEEGGRLEGAVRDQLRGWFGPEVSLWQHLETVRIPHALPALPPEVDPVERPATLADGLFVCGDHMSSASLQGAMLSGRRAAEAVESFLGVA